MSSNWWGAIGALAPMLLSGCLAVTLWDVEKVPQDDQQIDVRVSSRQADLDGTSCYMEREHRVTSRITVPDRSAILLGAILDGLGGLSDAGYEPDGSRAQYIAGAAATDAALSFLYIIFRDQKATVSTRWEPTNETGTCAR